MADRETDPWYSTRAGRRRHRQRRSLAVSAAAIALIVVAGAITLVVRGGDHPAKPDATVAAYLTAWSSHDWSAMQALVDRPPATSAC